MHKVKLVRIRLDVIVGADEYFVVFERKPRGSVWRLEACAIFWRGKGWQPFDGKPGSADVVAVARDLLVEQVKSGRLGG